MIQGYGAIREGETQKPGPVQRKIDDFREVLFLKIESLIRKCRWCDTGEDSFRYKLTGSFITSS